MCNKGYGTYELSMFLVASYKLPTYGTQTQHLHVVDVHINVYRRHSIISNNAVQRLTLLSLQWSESVYCVRR